MLLVVRRKTKMGILPLRVFWVIQLLKLLL